MSFLQQAWRAKYDWQKVKWIWRAGSGALFKMLSKLKVNQTQTTSRSGDKFEWLAELDIFRPQWPKKHDGVVFLGGFWVDSHSRHLNIESQAQIFFFFSLHNMSPLKNPLPQVPFELFIKPYIYIYTLMTDEWPQF